MFFKTQKKGFRFVAVTSDAAVTKAVSALAEAQRLSVTVRPGPVTDGTRLREAAADADLLLVDLDLADGRELDVLASLDLKLPFIVVADQPTIDDMRRLMRIGITDLLARPPSESDLLKAVEAAMGMDGRSPAGGGSAPPLRGRSIAFVGATGGVGNTTLAVHAAAALAKSGQEVGLLDLDLQFGSVAHALDIEPEYSMLDIISAPDRLDGALLRGLMHRHDSGIRVLCAGTAMPALHALEPDIAMRLVETARAEFPWVVFDMPMAWLDWSHAILAVVDTIVLTTRMSVPSLRHCRRQLETIAAELPQGKQIVLVANHHKPRLIGRDEREKVATKVLGRDFDIWVPGDPEAMAEAADTGATLFETKGGKKIRSQVERLAGLLAREATATPASAAKFPAFARQEA